MPYTPTVHVEILHHHRGIHWTRRRCDAIRRLSLTCCLFFMYPQLLNFIGFSLSMVKWIAMNSFLVPHQPWQPRQCSFVRSAKHKHKHALWLTHCHCRWATSTIYVYINKDPNTECGAHSELQLLIGLDARILLLKSFQFRGQLNS